MNWLGLTDADCTREMELTDHSLRDLLSILPAYHGAACVPSLLDASPGISSMFSEVQRKLNDSSANAELARIW